LGVGQHYISSLAGISYYQKNYHFGGENMEVIGLVGTFFTGLGLLLLSFGLFWFVDVYSKKK